MTFTPTTNSLQGFTCTVENLPIDDDFEELSLEQEIVSSAFWNKRQPLTPSDADLLWFIIGKWRNEGMSATHALAWLDNEELLDPIALMTGLAAFHTAEAQKPPYPPSHPAPPAPGMRSEPSREVLEAVAKGRAA